MQNRAEKRRQKKMNDHNEELKPDLPKRCPILNEACIEDYCHFRTELRQQMGGVMRKKSVCFVDAILLILSEINQKTAVPQQKPIEIPKLFMGRG